MKELDWKLINKITSICQCSGKCKPLGEHDGFCLQEQCNQLMLLVDLINKEKGISYSKQNI